MEDKRRNQEYFTLWEKEKAVLAEIKNLLKGTKYTLKTVHALWGDVWYTVNKKSLIPDWLYQIPFSVTEYPANYNRAFMEFGIFHSKYSKCKITVQTYLHRKERHMPQEVYTIAEQIQQILKARAEE
jgi:hypothetical protein